MGKVEKEKIDIYRFVTILTIIISIFIFTYDYFYINKTTSSINNINSYHIGDTVSVTYQENNTAKLELKENLNSLSMTNKLLERLNYRCIVLVVKIFVINFLLTISIYKLLGKSHSLSYYKNMQFITILSILVLFFNLLNAKYTYDNTINTVFGINKVNKNTLQVSGILYQGLPKIPTEIFIGDKLSETTGISKGIYNLKSDNKDKLVYGR